MERYYFIFQNDCLEATKMKLHECITDLDHPIYSPDKALELFKLKEIGPRKLSLMKQENIRMAGRDQHISLIDLRQALCSMCGYCFKYHSRSIRCENCILFRTFGQCDKLDNFRWAIFAESKEDFLKHHRLWCIEIGLWKDKWDR